MSYFLLTLLFFLIALVLAYCTFKLLFRQSWFIAWLRGMSGITLVLLTVVFGLLAFDVYSYKQFSGEKNVATISFSRLENQYYSANVTLASGENRRFDIHGDQWQLDSRIIKWKRLLNFVVLEAGYRLDRLNGRYLSLDDELSKPRSVYDISSSVTPVDFWQAIKSMNLEFIVDARYGSSTYLPMVDGGQYQVNITQNGLVARPLNETARQAIARWQ